MRFINAYAAAAVCSPTRAGILTGKCPGSLHLILESPRARSRPLSRRNHDSRVRIQALRPVCELAVLIPRCTAAPRPSTRARGNGLARLTSMSCTGTSSVTFDISFGECVRFAR